MKLISIDKVEEGMYLAKSIYIKDTHKLLLRKGTILTKFIIDSLKNNGISNIYIFKNINGMNQINMVNEEKQRQMISYIKAASTKIVNLFNCSSFGCNLERLSKVWSKNYLYTPVVNILEDIIEYTFSKDNILDYLLAIESIDEYTFIHSINVSTLALILGINLGLEKEELYDLYVGAILHDIGKSFVPIEYIKKENKLTDVEFDSVKKHTIMGYEYILIDSQISLPSKMIVLQHHERYDGLGYPYGLRGKQIHKLARIVTIADIYDALTSDRSYRKAVSCNEAMEYIQACGNIYFEHEMVLTFSRTILPYSKGMKVLLSNGHEGIVEETYPSFPLRPMIRITKGHNGTSLKFIDLRKELDIVIKKVIDNTYQDKYVL